ncbi:MAG: TonB-dependent receptor plug domain-containing protein [Bacteroidales bacterium]|nr:TonB-dependent receptor plug domain-containing protein [Bacteroidales bacterium]
MSRLLPILAATLLIVGCGAPKDMASGDSGKRNYNDGYMTSETHGAAHLEMKDAEAMSYQSFEDYVQARVAGVDIDANGNLVVRGIGTFNGSSKPLILMDGIEIQNTDDINPNEIYSVDVLKDASSTATYGFRGANGVLIITSKAAQHAKEVEREARQREKEAAKAARKAAKDAKKK